MSGGFGVLLVGGFGVGVAGPVGLGVLDGWVLVVELGRVEVDDHPLTGLLRLEALVLTRSTGEFAAADALRSLRLGIGQGPEELGV